jgi:hypothetical protein
VREPEAAGADTFFVGIAEPLPVGTLVTLKMGDVVREARVDDVVESAEPSAAGMRLRWGGAAPASRPAPAVEAAPAPAPAAAPKAPEPAAPPQAAPAQAAAPSPPTMGDSGPAVAVEVAEDGSGAISAPLSLASPSGDGQPGGGKRRRKRR